MDYNFGRALGAAPRQSRPHRAGGREHQWDNATTAKPRRSAPGTARRVSVTAAALTFRVLLAATLIGGATKAVHAQAGTDTSRHYIDTLGMGGPLRTHADSVRARAIMARRDSLARIAVRLGAVTITSTPVQPSDPIDVVRVTPLMIAQTPANSPLELAPRDGRPRSPRARAGAGVCVRPVDPWLQLRPLDGHRAVDRWRADQ